MRAINNLVRWDRLFEDFESQTQAEHRLRFDGELAERARYEFGLLTLQERVESCLGLTVELRLRGGHTLCTRLTACGTDWLMGEQPTHNAECVINLASLVTVVGLPRAGQCPPACESGEIAGGEALALRHVLRGLSRDRVGVEILLIDGGKLSGTIDRVARDHFELAVHPSDVARRERVVTQRAVVLNDAVAAARIELC